MRMSVHTRVKIRRASGCPVLVCQIGLLFLRSTSGLSLPLPPYTLSVLLNFFSTTYSLHSVCLSRCLSACLLRSLSRSKDLLVAICCLALAGMWPIAKFGKNSLEAPCLSSYSGVQRFASSCGPFVCLAGRKISLSQSVLLDSFVRVSAEEPRLCLSPGMKETALTGLT